MWVFVTLVLLDIVLYVALDYTHTNLQPTSRRMANLSFIVWMVSKISFQHQNAVAFPFNKFDEYSTLTVYAYISSGKMENSDTLS